MDSYYETLLNVLLQPRTVAGFRGTVRYASINAHKNKVSVVSASERTPTDQTQSEHIHETC